MLVPGDPPLDQPDADAVPDGTDVQPQRFRLTSDARAEAADRRRLDQDLRHALAQGQFVLHFQPRVAVGTGRPVGAEALIRWPHRKRGMVSPATFLPVAERSGLITRIGAWVVQTACTEAMTWPARCSVSVNVSARQLVDAALLDHVAAALDASGLPPERLELELAESMLVDVGLDTLLTLSAVRDLGVGVALDDFGTGYASLASLKRLPLTVLKLDRSLVRGLPDDAEDRAIVRAVIEAGHALGLTIVAEGIETEAQRVFLAECGCDEAQGYLFSHPLPTERLRIRLIG
ncbi:MAG: EAL domain-containing protein [Acidisphaera sp.]|nr:EAL domain-containing protein [Acidisphaera sp.]